jgi:DnaJ like chaperone protein
MFEKGIESAYQVLEIDRNVADAEVKLAYKRLAVKHHPDKVASLGADVQRAAELKFKAINEAYERIKKERGMR